MTIVHVSEGGMSKCLPHGTFWPPPPSGPELLTTHNCQITDFGKNIID